MSGLLTRPRLAGLSSVPCMPSTSGAHHAGSIAPIVRVRQALQMRGPAAACIAQLLQNLRFGCVHAGNPIASSIGPCRVADERHVPRQASFQGCEWRRRRGTGPRGCSPATSSHSQGQGGDAGSRIRSSAARGEATAAGRGRSRACPSPTRAQAQSGGELIACSLSAQACMMIAMQSLCAAAARALVQWGPERVHAARWPYPMEAITALHDLPVAGCGART